MRSSPASSLSSWPPVRLALSIRPWPASSCCSTWRSSSRGPPPGCPGTTPGDWGSGSRPSSCSSCGPPRRAPGRRCVSSRWSCCSPCSPGSATPRAGEPGSGRSASQWPRSRSSSLPRVRAWRPGRPSTDSRPGSQPSPASSPASGSGWGAHGGGGLGGGPVRGPRGSPRLRHRGAPPRTCERHWRGTMERSAVISPRRPAGGIRSVRRVRPRDARREADGSPAAAGAAPHARS